MPGGSHYNTSVAGTHSNIVTHDNDPNLGTLMPDLVYSGNYSWRVEDVVSGGCGSVISQQVNNYFCPDIYFVWLAVLENGGHATDTSAFMIIELKDVTVGDTVFMRVYNARAGSSGIDTRFNRSGAYFYTPSWQIEHVSINSTRTGYNFTIIVLSIDCAANGHSGYVYIDDFGSVAP